YDRVKQPVGQVHPILIHQIVKPGYQTERLRISLKMIEVLLHLFREHLFYKPSAECEFRQVPAEPLPDRQLAEMSEGRIPDIVDQAGALKDVGNILPHLRRKSGIPAVCQDILSDVLSERFAERRHLQGMRKP